MGIGDVVAMMEHSYYSVISPEGCSSILWKDGTKNAVAAAALKMHVEDLLELGIVDQMIKEPLGGAHLDPQLAFANMKQFIKEQWNLLKAIPIDVLLENRYQKFRRMGKFETLVTPES
jgi:acetyl-CoA carboxylase carboxyl transferase subunit alpha